MNIEWNISSEDIGKVGNFCKTHMDNPFVKKRIERNLSNQKDVISKDIFSKTMVCCLLTTQQRSGPGSNVTRFIKTNPFPLDYRRIISEKDIESFTQRTITAFGGIRRANRIGEEISENIKALEGGLWEKVFNSIKKLQEDRTVSAERSVCEFTLENFKGFGPKQSRNLWQSLGLTRYEIPIDSRIAKWLNSFGFPVTLSSTALSDGNYYNFVSDGIQLLCEKTKIMPCVLDAVVFASYDKGKWTEENVVW